MNETLLYFKTNIATFDKLTIIEVRRKNISLRKSSKVSSTGSEAIINLISICDGFMVKLILIGDLSNNSQLYSLRRKKQHRCIFQVGFHLTNSAQLVYHRLIDIIDKIILRFCEK